MFDALSEIRCSVAIDTERSWMQARTATHNVEASLLACSWRSSDRIWSHSSDGRVMLGTKADRYSAVGLLKDLARRESIGGRPLNKNSRPSPQRFTSSCHLCRFGTLGTGEFDGPSLLPRWPFSSVVPVDFVELFSKRGNRISSDSHHTC